MLSMGTNVSVKWESGDVETGYEVIGKYHGRIGIRKIKPESPEDTLVNYVRENQLIYETESDQLMLDLHLIRSHVDYLADKITNGNLIKEDAKLGSRLIELAGKVAGEVNIRLGPW